MINWFKSVLYGKQVDAEAGLSDPDLVTRYRELLTDPNGILYVSLAVDDTAVGLVNPNADGKASTDLLGLATSSVNYLFNETSFDRQRNNTEQTILASAARTANTNSADFTNHNARGAHFYVDVTAVSGSPSIEVKIQGKDPVSGGYYNLLVSNVLSAVSVTILKIYPGIGAVANQAASDILLRTYRVSVTHSNADSITYSVGASLVV